MKNPNRPQSRIRRNRTKAFWDGVFSQNPVLAGGAGISLVAVGGRSVQLAFPIFLLQFALLIPVGFLGIMMGKKISPWLRAPFLLLTSSAIYLPAGWAMAGAFPVNAPQLGVCGMLIAANTVAIVLHVQALAEKDWLAGFIGAIGNGAGFGIVLVTVSCIWEILMSFSGEDFCRAEIVMLLLAIACLGGGWQYLKNRRGKKRKEEWP